MKFFTTSAMAQEGCIKTASRLHKWWLTTVKNYTVMHVFKQPKPGILGNVAYSQMWLLKPPSK